MGDVASGWTWSAPRSKSKAIWMRDPGSRCTMIWGSATCEMRRSMCERFGKAVGGKLKRRGVRFHSQVRRFTVGRERRDECILQREHLKWRYSAAHPYGFRFVRSVCSPRIHMALDLSACSPRIHMALDNVGGRGASRWRREWVDVEQLVQKKIRIAERKNQTGHQEMEDLQRFVPKFHK